jgi:hypothetical protein
MLRFKPGSVQGILLIKAERTGECRAENGIFSPTGQG